MSYSDCVATIGSIAEGLCYLTPIGPASLLTVSQAELTVLLTYEEISGAEQRRRGTAYLILSHGLPTTLGANMLGCADQSRITQELAADAAYELANVLTGNLLPQIFGKEREFQLSSPRTGPYPISLPLEAFSLTTEEGVLSWAHSESV